MTKRSGTSDIERQIVTDTGPFAIVPEWVLDSEISDRAVRLYAILSRYADSDGWSWPSRKTLATRIGRSVDALDRAVRELVDYGMLTVVARYDDAGDRTSNGYTIARMNPAAMRPGSRSSAATGSRTDAATGSRSSAALMRASVNESQLNETALAMPDADRPRDVVWETMLEVCGIDPDKITKSSRGAYNRAARDLREAGADRTSIVEHAFVFRRRWPQVSLTPTALARRWPECDPTTQHGTSAPMTDIDRATLGKLVDAWEGDAR
jgi:hypothetical protein